MSNMYTLYKGPFPNCIRQNANEHWYKDKKHFISDFCAYLQSCKKYYIEHKNLNPLWVNKRFFIQSRECWHFQIGIHKDKFKILFCEATLYDTIFADGTKDRTIRYCYGEDHDTFRNITEFREFLKREVCKEDG